MELGINTCFAVKRWPRPADWAPIVREVLGLSLVQVSLDLLDLDGEPDALRRDIDEHLEAADRYGLRLHSAFTGLAAYSSNLMLHPRADQREAAERWYERAIAFTAAIGGSAVGGHLGAFSVPDWNDADRRAERWTDLKVRLARLAVSARSAGLDCLLVENLAARREPSTMADIVDLTTDGDAERAPIRLCLDVGHMCVPETVGPDRDPYVWLSRLGKSAAVIQLQQSDADGDHHWPFTATRNDQGRIEAARVLEALGAGVSAPLVLEVIPPFEQSDAEVLQELTESAAYWGAAMTGIS